MENSEAYKNLKILILQKLCDSNLLAYENFMSDLEKSYLKLNQIVTPLTEKENSLRRNLLILNLKKQLLDKSLEGRNIRELNSYYQFKIKNLKEEIFLPAYKDLLKAREGIYRDGKLIKLNEENLTFELQNLWDQIEKNEMVEYQKFTVPSASSEIKDLLNKIKISEDCIYLQLEELCNMKELATDDYYNRQNRLENFHETLNKDLHEYITTFRDNEIKIIIEGKSLEFLKKRLSLEKNKREFLKITCPGALHYACEYGAFEIVQFLINEMGYSVLYKHDGYYPIHDAVKKFSSNCIDILNFLFSLDKNVIYLTGIYGRSPLHTATVFDNFEAVKWLLNNGADINLKETGAFQSETALHNAAFNGNTLIVQYLIDKGADPRAKSKNEVTPLMRGIKEGHLEVVLIFWDNGIWLTSDELSSLLKLPLNKNQHECLEIPLKKFSQTIEIAMKKHSNN